MATVVPCSMRLSIRRAARRRNGSVGREAATGVEVCSGVEVEVGADNSDLAAAPQHVQRDVCAGVRAFGLGDGAFAATDV